MGRVYVDFDGSVPRYVCTDCSHCTSTIGKSLCHIKNRGCCWYFPKFELIDIQRMAKTLEGLHLLNTIKHLPGSVVYRYYIHARGFFDQNGYEEYKNAGRHLSEDSIKDHTIFFRACPFVKDGCGCTLPPRYRTYICNFFICDEIVNEPTLQDAFKPYLDERYRYARWLQRENIGLQYMLSEKGVDLVTNFDGAVELLRNTPLNLYEFPVLSPIETGDIWPKGA